MTFFERLELLTEFALRLSVAKNLVKQVKSDPMVQPYLVNGKIRRGETSNFGIPVRQIAKRHKVGLIMEKGGDNPLEILAHEYGHAQHASETINHSARLQRLIDSPRLKINPSKSNINTRSGKSEASMQMARMRLSRTITRERMATQNGAASLVKAGANNSELRDYYKAINPIPNRGDFQTMHPSYEEGYRLAKKRDPKQRAGGTKGIASPAFPHRLG